MSLSLPQLLLLPKNDHFSDFHSYCFLAFRHSFLTQVCVSPDTVQSSTFSKSVVRLSNLSIYEFTCMYHVRRQNQSKSHILAPANEAVKIQRAGANIQQALKQTRGWGHASKSRNFPLNPPHFPIIHSFASSINNTWELDTTANSQPPAQT